MTKKKNRSQRRLATQSRRKVQAKTGPPKTNSLLDIMEDGREFESVWSYQAENVDMVSEIRRSIKEISDIRGRDIVCYISNVVNTQIKNSRSIDYKDDLPFSEMIDTIPQETGEIDVILVTPGGSGSQVAKFVDKLRPRFSNVSFIIPDISMSAGTILVMSGDEIVMDSRAYIGPIDPQVRNKNGAFVPAQSIQTLINDIQTRGQDLLQQGKQPNWTDIQILRQIDPKEIGNAIAASNYSIELVKNYLYNYKFKTWVNHSNGSRVTDAEKQQRAKEIAEQLCDHSLWKNHGRGITREDAWDICKLKITHAEDTPGLERAVRRFWALFNWVFETSFIYKVFVSKDYAIFRHESPSKNK